MIIVDTDILIDAGRGDQKAIDRLNQLEMESIVAITVVTEMELIVGCRNQEELKKLELFLNRYQKITLTANISERAIGLLKKFRLSHGLLIADALIAATALENSMKLISKNQRHFRYINELDLLSY